tara:strand:- start:142 stop:279 length:138 start_codon:yes stop_codon:yes gene_type:complete
MDKRMLTIAIVIALVVVLFLSADHFDWGLKEITGNFIDIPKQTVD